MKKIITLLLVLCHLTGCSAFAPTQQKVSVLTNVADAKIYANGEFIREGQEAEFFVRRDNNAQIMIIADGYHTAYKQIGSELNTLGILDIIGGIVWLVPFLGLCFPGSKSLDSTNIAIQLIPTTNNKQ